MSELSDRQRNAKALKENPLLPEIIRECRRTIIARWITSQETIEREATWSMFHAIEAFENQLNALVDGIVSTISED